MADALNTAVETASGALDTAVDVRARSIRLRIWIVGGVIVLIAAALARRLAGKGQPTPDGGTSALR